MNESNPDPQLDALFAMARTCRPNTATAEYAFETRVMARLHAAHSPDSVWAMVSWRLAPFFALCVVTLALWHTEVVREADEAEQVAYVENPTALDSWANLN